VIKKALMKCLFNQSVSIQSQDLNQDERDCYQRLLKSGILTIGNDETPQFSSPMAFKYYMAWLFPNRSGGNPSSIKELVKNAIQNMSASVLRQSVVEQGHFPKEAIFQHLFMQGLAANTPPPCVICPELSHTFPSSVSSCTHPIGGEVDFYLNGDLRWGLELLVNGDRLTEHLDRFGPKGKYFNLNVKDYAVIDFRGNMNGDITNVGRHEKRITVFFKLGDFTSAKCIFFLEREPVIFDLSN